MAISYMVMFRLKLHPIVAIDLGNCNGSNLVCLMASFDVRGAI